MPLKCLIIYRNYWHKRWTKCLCLLPVYKRLCQNYPDTSAAFLRVCAWLYMDSDSVIWIFCPYAGCLKTSMKKVICRVTGHYLDINLALLPPPLRPHSTPLSHTHKHANPRTHTSLFLHSLTTVHSIAQHLIIKSLSITPSHRLVLHNTFKLALVNHHVPHTLISLLSSQVVYCRLELWY